MGTVSDVLSCAGLLGLGLYAGTAAGGVALGASAVNLLQGVAGNAGFKLHETGQREVAARLLGGWRGIDENHVVVQALRQAYLAALTGVQKTYRRRARATKQRIEHEVVDYHIGVFVRQEAEDTKHLLFARQGSSATAQGVLRRAVLDKLPGGFSAGLAARGRTEEQLNLRAFDDIREGVVAATLAEIQGRRARDPLPELFVEVFRADWFDLFIRSAASALKEQGPFEAIWNAEQQARMLESLGEVHVQLAGLARMMEVSLEPGRLLNPQLARVVERRPADLLLAGYQVVPFVDYHGTLAATQEWVLKPEPQGATGRLYVAPGGFGKTRLAIELIQRVANEGWAATFLSNRNAARLAQGALDALVEAKPSAEAGTLLVLDYVESQIPLLKQAAQAARRAPQGHQLRVLALARSPEGWWAGACHECGDLFDPAPYALLDRPPPEEDRPTLLDAATEAFAAALGTAAPASPALVGGPARCLDRPLSIAMLAYLRARGAKPEGEQSLLEMMLLEERRHWKPLLDVVRDNDTAPFHRLVAQVTLLLGTSAASAEALLASQSYAGYGRETKEKWLRALQVIYGRPEQQTWSVRSVEPDLLGEHLAMAALASPNDTLVQEILQIILADPQNGSPGVANLLEVLVRATRPEHDQRTRDNAAAAIAIIGAGCKEMPRQAIFALAAALPSKSDPLAHCAVAVAERALELANSPAETAVYLQHLSGRLGAAGDEPRALTAAQQSVSLWKVLAEANPEAHRRSLASSLNNLGNRLGEAGDLLGALEVTTRSVELYETLALSDDAGWQADLAMTLSNLGIRLSGAGENARALAPSKRAVELHEALARAEPISYRPLLANSLNNLGIRLDKAGDTAGALAAARRTLEIREPLAQTNPAAYRADLASSLLNLGIYLGKLDDKPGALAATQRAVGIYEQLAKDTPGAYLAEWAKSLNNLSDDLGAMDDRAGALEASRHSVALYETLAAASPTAYQPSLAMSLDSLAIELLHADETKAAVASAQRSATFYAVLAKATPAVYRRYLANSLNTLGCCLAAAAAEVGALQAARQSVELYEELYASEPRPFRKALAFALSNLAERLAKAGDHASAEAARARVALLQEAELP